MASDDFLHSLLSLPAGPRDRVLRLFDLYPQLKISAEKLFADKVQLGKTKDRQLQQQVLMAERETINNILKGTDSLAPISD